MGPRQFCWIQFDKETKKFKLVSEMYDDFNAGMEAKDEILKAYPGSRMFEGVWG